MLRRSSKFSVVLLLFWATTAWSICQEAIAPDLPNPDWVDGQDVRRAQLAVKQYIQDQDIFLACVKGVGWHNAAVSRMHDVAKKYNEMARRYKARKNSMNIMTDFVFYFDESSLVEFN